MAVVASADVEINAAIGKFERDLKAKVNQVASRTKASIEPEVKTGAAARGIKGFNSLVEGAEQRLGKLGFTTRDVSVLMGAGLAGGVAFAARSVIRFGASLVEAASALQEQRSASEAVFDANSALVQSFADSTAAIGLSERAALEASNRLGGLFINLGIGSELAAQLSTAFVALGQDISSLRDVSPEAVQTALISGLVGETEAVRRLSIDISANRIEREALSRGIVENAADLSEGQKQLIRYAIAVEDSQVALGNFEDTADGVANSQRQLTAEWENAKAALGESLQGPVTFVTQRLTELVSVIDDLATASFKFAIGDFQGALERLIPPTRENGSLLEKLHDVLFGIPPAVAANETAIQAAADAALDAARNYRDFVGAAQELEELLPNLDSKLDSVREQQESSAERIGDAQRSLSRTIRDTNERNIEARERLVEVEERAAQSIQDAQEQLAKAYVDSQERIAEAQKAAADSIETANERVIDSAERVTEAEADLGRTRIDVAKSIADAQERLDNLTTRRRESTRQRRLREIAEAEENLEEARVQGAQRVLDAEGGVQDARERLAEDERDLAETRVEAAQRVAEAQEDSAERISEAQRALVLAQQQATKDIGDAQKALARTIRDSAESVQDSQRAVARAHDAAAESARKQNRELNELIDAAQKADDALTPYERALLRTAEQAGNAAEKVKVLTDFLNSLQDRNIQIDVTLNPEIAIEGGKIKADLVFSDDGSVKVVPRQHGGPFGAGDTLLVGEDGPELVRFGQSGQVDSNADLVAALNALVASNGGSSRPSVHQEFHNSFPMPSNADPDVLARAIAARLARWLTR